MEDKYKKVIKTGIIFGIIMIAAAVVVDPLVQYLSNTPDVVEYSTKDISYGSQAFGMMPLSVWIVLGLSALLGLFNLTMYFLCGVFAVRSAKEYTQSLWDASNIGGIAAVISVIVACPVITVYHTILSLVFASTSTVRAATGGLLTFACCFPTYIVIAVIIGAVGGVAFKALRH